MARPLATPPPAKSAARPQAKPPAPKPPAAKPVAQAVLTEAEREARQRSLALHLQLLSHATACFDDKCPAPGCANMKGHLVHSKTCTVKVSGGCDPCKRVDALLQLHARMCESNCCAVPRCAGLKIAKQQQQLFARSGVVLFSAAQQRARRGGEQRTEQALKALHAKYKTVVSERDAVVRERDAERALSAKLLEKSKELDALHTSNSDGLLKFCHVSVLCSEISLLVSADDKKTPETLRRAILSPAVQSKVDGALESARGAEKSNESADAWIKFGPTEDTV
jgi:hypothetical protein